MTVREVEAREVLIQKITGLSENDMYHRIYDVSEEMGSCEFHDLMLSVIQELEPVDRARFLGAYARWQENDNEFNKRF